jgi:hypothetical protein
MDREKLTRLKEITVWIYMGILPFFIFLAYYIGKGGNLDYWEKTIVMLVLLAHMLLHNYMIIQFIKVINNEQVG